MENKLDIAYVLIDKAYTGQASASELSRIDMWRKASGENASIYDDTIQLLTLVNGITGWRDFDGNQGWNVLERKIKDTRLVIKWKKLMAAAAIFLLVLTATFWKIGSSDSNLNSNEIVGTEQKYSFLADGSELILTPNAIVNLDDFTEGNRHLATSGNYFVHVKSNPVAPFEIQTKKVKIQVLGTSFNVEEEADVTIVRVREGKVRITSDNGTSHTLRGGEKLEYLDGSVKVSRLENDDWGLFTKSYIDQPVANLLQDLKSKFPYIQFDQGKISEDCKITTKINQSTILEILEELSLLFEVSYTINAGHIVISKISC